MNNIIFKTTLKEPLKASKGNKTAQKATNQSLTNLFNNHQPTIRKPLNQLNNLCINDLFLAALKGFKNMKSMNSCKSD